MSRIVGRLADQGIRLTLDQVDGQRASDRVPYTRPHVARALVRDGYATSVTEAFDRYIGSDCPAYVLVESPTPEEVIGSIRAAGGVAVWAHPPLRHMTELLPRLAAAGLRGVEVFRPWPRRVREAVASNARRAGLFATGVPTGMAVRATANWGTSSSGARMFGSSWKRVGGRRSTLACRESQTWRHTGPESRPRASSTSASSTAPDLAEGANPFGAKCHDHPPMISSPRTSGSSPAGNRNPVQAHLSLDNAGC